MTEVELQTERLRLVPQTPEQVLAALEALSPAEKAEVPPKVEYSLTPLGQSLQPVLMARHKWGEAYARNITKRR
jgi:DNA-binding HxlR family transcriptional regulator